MKPMDPLAGLATPAVATKKKKIVAGKTKTPVMPDKQNRTSQKAEPVPDLAPIRQSRY